MHVLPLRMAAVVAVITVGTFVPRTASAQEYEKWYKQSEQQFLDLKQKARGGTRMTWDKLPDWTGIWTHDGGTRFDPKIPNYAPTSAKLTPEYRAKFEKKLADQKQGVEWDHLSYCLPAGFPRWITEPFLREPSFFRNQKRGKRDSKWAKFLAQAAALVVAVGLAGAMVYFGQMALTKLKAIQKALSARNGGSCRPCSWMDGAGWGIIGCSAGRAKEKSPSVGQQEC